MFVKIVFTSLLMLSALTTQASVIDVTFKFADPTWSGTASFDETTGQPWATFASFTAYALETLSITRADAVTWDETMWFPEVIPPVNGIIQGPNGRFALSGAAWDGGSNFLTTSFGWGAEGVVASSLFSNNQWSSEYTAARVAEPHSFGLIGLGLSSLVMVRRRRNSKR